MFFLQGGQDYQVTVEEFDLWKDMLNERDNVDFKLYDELNHLFLQGHIDYNTPSNIPHYVMEDITNWINKKK